MNETKQIFIETADIEGLIFAINEVCKGLYNVAYTSNADGIMKDNPALTKEQNAVEFVNQYADMTGGVLRMVETATDIITRRLVNDEIKITLQTWGKDAPERIDHDED